MSETKFTKGDWEIDERWVDRVFCDDSTGSLVAVTGGKEFTTIRRSEEEVTANAHLIAAAPLMYELLESIRVTEQISGGDMWSEKIEQLLCNARGEQ